MWCRQFSYRNNSAASLLFFSSAVSQCCSSTPPHTVLCWSSSSAQVCLHVGASPACQSSRVEANTRVCGVRGHARNTSPPLFILLGLNHNAGSEIGCERPRYKAAQPPLSQYTRDCSTPQPSKFKEVWALINLFPLCFPIAFVGGKNELYLKAISVSPG